MSNELCRHCGRALRFEPERGWVHAHGGGLYWMRCAACGWQGSGMVKCPVCGSVGGLRDDHCALPDMCEILDDDAKRDEARRLGWVEGFRRREGVGAGVI